MISQKYEERYNEIIDHYKKIHVNPWHNIKEDELNDFVNKYTVNNDINDKYEFTYFMNLIIKKLNGREDNHTYWDVYEFIPLNFKLFDDVVLINYPNELKGCELVSINDVPIKNILEEIDEIISYGTLGKKRVETEKALFNEVILFGLPSLKKSSILNFKYKNLSGEHNNIIINKGEKHANMFDYRKYVYGNNATYYFRDNCLIYNHSSLQNIFEEDIKNAISNLKKENLENIDTIIIDIRGNSGGNSRLNSYLIDYLKEHLDKKIICLTDYRVFSGGRYALNDLINLGAITIGEEISTPINCYGNSNHLKYNGCVFSSSSSYLHPYANTWFNSKEEFEKNITDDLLKPCIFKPDILVNEIKEDYIKGIDTILEYAIEYTKNNTRK